MELTVNANCIVTYLGLAVIYTAVSAEIFFELYQGKIVRTLLTQMLSATFFFLAVCFLIYAFLAPKDFWIIETVSFVAGALPIIFFIWLRPWIFAAAQKEDPKSHQLRRFEKMKEEFLSMASHELRTPLSVITGFAEILVREKIGPLNDEQKRRIRKIIMQGQRLNRILNELLDLSRIRSGKIEVKKEVFDVVTLLKACLDDQQILCDQQQLTLRDQIPDVLPDVEGDLERTTQVIINLLNNAIKYTEPGGSITVSAIYNDLNKEIRVEIRDTGIGIAPEYQAHVFDEFYRVNHEAAKKVCGSGLGLAIVKQLVETQKGRVGVFSEGQDKGSLFYFTLPTAKGSAVPAPTAITQAA